MGSGKKVIVINLSVFVGDNIHDKRCFALENLDESRR